MKQDLLWEAAMQAIYGESTILTDSERGRMNKALKQLRAVKATPEDVIARAKRYPQVMPPGCTLTITGLVANWARCKPKSRSPQASYIPPPSIPLLDRIEAAREAKLNLPPYLARRLLKED